MPASKKEKKLVRAEQARTGVCYTEALTRVRLRNNAPRNQAPEMTMTLNNPTTNTNTSIPEDFDEALVLLFAVFRQATQEAEAMFKVWLGGWPKPHHDPGYEWWVQWFHDYRRFRLCVRVTSARVRTDKNVDTHLHLELATTVQPTEETANFLDTVLRLARMASSEEEENRPGPAPSYPGEPRERRKPCLHYYTPRWPTNLRHERSESVQLLAASEAPDVYSQEYTDAVARFAPSIRPLWPRREELFQAEFVRTQLALNSQMPRNMEALYKDTPEYLHPDGGYTDESYNHMNNPFAEAVSDEP